jgi:hypothetical protein
MEGLSKKRKKERRKKTGLLFLSFSFQLYSFRVIDTMWWSNSQLLPVSPVSVWGMEGRREKERTKKEAREKKKRKKEEKKESPHLFPSTFLFLHLLPYPPSLSLPLPHPYHQRANG